MLNYTYIVVQCYKIYQNVYGGAEYTIGQTKAKQSIAQITSNYVFKRIIDSYMKTSHWLNYFHVREETNILEFKAAIMSCLNIIQHCYCFKNI